MGDQIDEDEDDDAFWRKMTLPWEDKDQAGREAWRGIGYRWFRSPNVIDLVQVRRARESRPGPLPQSKKAS